MDDFKLIVCGRPEGGAAKKSLDHLGTTLTSFGERALYFLTAPPEEENFIFAPLCGRVILENSLAAITGRLDPFRLIYLSEFQAKEEYEVGKKAKSAFGWSGDILPSNTNNNMWSIDHEITKISRSLFSQYSEEFYWKKALEDALDHINDTGKGPNCPEIVALDPTNFMRGFAGRSAQVYSALSKAVHWEFFTPAATIDEQTTKNLIRDVLSISSTFGLLSHYIPTAHSRIPPSEAVDNYITFTERL